MNIELYYFDGCPTYTQALDNLMSALTLERVTAEVEMIRVRGEADEATTAFLLKLARRIERAAFLQ